MTAWIGSMKSSIRIIAVVSFLFSVNCKKWPIDYRNRFTGAYSFSWSMSDWDGSSWVTTTDKTEGKIYYQPFHNWDKSISIKINSGRIFEAKVDREGSLHAKEGELYGNITASVVSFTAFTPGKPGTAYTVTGTRN
jgi:hypothetical protein